MNSKKILTIIGALFVTTAASFSVQAAVKIVTCEPEWAALTSEVAGSQVNVTSITKAGDDPHHIQARPSLISNLKQADMVFCSGAGLEDNWLPKLLNKAGNNKLSRGRSGYFMAVDSIRLLASDEHDSEELHAEGNPHLHMNPHNILRIAKELTGRLQKIDPANASVYTSNANLFIKRWKRAIDDWEVKASPLKGIAVVVNHENWAYLSDWLGLREISALESPNPEFLPVLPI